MNGDYTRNTFQSEKHYQQVLMQQGRAQLDADWNELSALAARRDETTADDLIGPCGGPLGGAAFGILSSPPANQPAAAPGDLYLSSGRYYVDGVQCELEQPMLLSRQPHWPNGKPLEFGQSFLLYLDVWRRHVTALEDEDIREPALGGPDTATRVQTVWQVRVKKLDKVDADDPCSSGDDFLAGLRDPLTARLTAGTEPGEAVTDPCLVPPGAGYRGLENQLYRVEIHHAGQALSAPKVNSGTAVELRDTPTQLKLASKECDAGDLVEVFSTASATPESLMRSQVAVVTAVSAGNVVTLDAAVVGLSQSDQPRLRRIAGPDPAAAKNPNATWKWSRENGSVVTRLERIDPADSRRLTVSSPGPDAHLGFRAGDWVEILDDAVELEGRPGQLVRIAAVDEAARVITLGASATSLVPADPVQFPPAKYPQGVVPERHPKLRRWDGVGAVKFSTNSAANWLPLENGVRVRFQREAAGPDGKPQDAQYRTGHYWQIPARAATASSPNGDILWPREMDGGVLQPLALPPQGIRHHFCRLGVVAVDGKGAVSPTSDCRHLFPPLTELLSLFYLGGDGQEVAPDPTQPANLLPLPAPLQVGVAQGQWPVAAARVQFTIQQGAGKLQADGKVKTDEHGIASCSWQLDSTTLVQQVEAVLQDDAGNPLHLPVRFTARLSLASQIAYDPKDCKKLAGATNVQDAIDRLCRAEHGGGCCVTVGEGGQFARLEDAIQALLARKRTDLCICLLPGDHPLSSAANLVVPAGGPDVHLHVHGCGPGTRATLANDSWRLEGLASFTFRDLALTAAPGVRNPVQVLQCEEVTVRDCHWLHFDPASAVLAIRGAERVQVCDNVIEVVDPGRITTLQGVFRGSPGLQDLFGKLGQPAFSRSAKAAAGVLATSPRQERAAIVAAANDNLRLEARRLTAEEKASYAAALEALTAEPFSERLLATRLDNLRLAVARAQPVLALVIAGAEASCLLESNTIAGAVSFYGEPGQGDNADLTMDELKRLGSVIPEKPGVFAAARGTVHLRGNLVTRFAVGEAMIKQLRGLVSGDNPALDGIFQVGLLTDNVVEGGRNQFVGAQLSWNANVFQHLDKANGGAGAGWTISDTGVFQGNQSPLALGMETRLLNVARHSFPNPKANANHVIQIADLGQ